MSDTCDSTVEQLCGCCDGIAQETPAPIYNRPALSQITYRVGVFTSFKASMLAALSKPQYMALGGLTTRDDRDFTIALLDAWALVSDIATFYQERAANETYLRTATLTRSVFELARLVGYQPTPGVAASAPVAFMLNNAPGAPDPVLIPAGSCVQSTPGPGQSAQTFETSADLTAYIEHNALSATTTVPASLSAGASTLWLSGTATSLKTGDGILFIASECETDADSEAWEFRHVTTVTTDAANGRTQIGWDQPLRSTLTSAASVTLFALRKRASLYGYNAPDPKVLASQTLQNYPSSAFTYAADSTIIDWAFQSGTATIALDQVYQGIVPSTNAPSPTWIVLAQGTDRWFYQVNAVNEGSLALYTISSKATQLTLAAPAGSRALGKLATFQQSPRETAAFVQSESLAVSDQPYTQNQLATGEQLQAGMLAPVVGKSFEVGGGQRLAAGRRVAVSGKRLRIGVTQTGVYLLPANGQNPISVNIGDVFLVDAFPSVQVVMPAAIQLLSGVVTDTATSSAWSVLTTTGQPGVLYVGSQNIVLQPSDKADPLASEAALLESLDMNGTSTTLHFAQPLTRIYDRATVIVNANVIQATNGQTVNELLGNGDSSQSTQTFKLKQTPLTYISGSTGEGAQSTLQIWVNELRWHEVPSLLGHGPAERIFVTRIAQDGTVSVQFGDGITGGRLPTGQMNVRAVYRKGIGAAGNVDVLQLNQALDRPSGLKSASNPAPASGGADPATLADARTSAPLHVLTLDRVVSLEDYENYALAFAGIAKALATWTWFGRTRGVFVTVAGADGDALDPAGTTLGNLVTAYRQYGSPYVPIQVMSYQPRWFSVGGNVNIDQATYDAATVLANVSDALTQAFGFASCALGARVGQSRIIETIQDVPGVVAVQLTVFNRDDQGATPGAPLADFLPASAPLSGERGVIAAAELLMLDVASLKGLKVWS
ncbi:putative baseplate assembly protein [Burkholderia sp. R-69980]|nr:putative baseplate assembly protein [Burkholderia sp. R-69980]